MLEHMRCRRDGAITLFELRRDTRAMRHASYTLLRHAITPMRLTREVLMRG